MDKREGGNQDIPSKIFRLTVPEKIHRGIVFRCIHFGYRKSLENRDWRGEYQDFPSTTFCHTVLKLSLGESFTVALISVTEKVSRRWKGEVEIFRRKNFVSQCRRNLVGESFFVALFSGIAKVWIRRGEYPDFPSTVFCHTVPKSYVGESFSVALSLGSENFWIGGRGEDQYFPLKTFCLTVPKISVGESFTVALVSSIDKVWIRRVGVSRSSVENFLSHSAEKVRTGTLYCCINFGYRKNLEEREWGGSIKISRRQFFVTQCRKFTYENPLVLH